jgi:hypothetical protein
MKAQVITASRLSPKAAFLLLESIRQRFPEA